MHKSVLLNETITSLNIKENGIYVDATLGYGGHSGEILKRIKRGFLFAFDQDSDAIKYSKQHLTQIGENFQIIKSNFINMKEELQSHNIDSVDGVLFDLGVSSPQLDDAKRGFSYHSDAKLDMRMDQTNPLSAYEVVNQYSEEKLTEILYKYGEEKHAKIISRNIIKNRRQKPIETTLELANIITNSYPMKERLNKHPARKSFQAIRIEVNKELEILEESIKNAINMLNINGRVAVITFHSLEDKIVKTIFKTFTEEDKIAKGMPNMPEDYLPKYRLITKNAIIPSEEEQQENPRSRSSKLRVIEKIK